MSLPARALRTIRKHAMFPPGARVLVALSGGPDSVALLHILLELQARGELVVAGAAHFNHRLRDTEADGDEWFCRDLAAAVGCAFEAGSADVAAAARGMRRSIEDTARTLRYEFLRDAARLLAADVVAVGHSLDDQAETFLLRLLRGAGARGLAGIRPTTGLVVRPLIEISREDLRRYVAEHQLAFREDASNRDVRIMRNRVRHQLIPQLRQFSPGVARILAREAEVARQDEEYLHRAAIESGAANVLRTERGIEIDIAGLAGLPVALAARVIREALSAAAPGRFIAFEHIDRVLELASAREGASVAVPGCAATRQGGRIVLGMARPEPFSNFLRVPLSIPGEVVLAGWAVSAERMEGPAEVPPQSARAGQAIVSASPDCWPLAVRTRQPGDRFRPFGMGGRGRKLQDFLVDRKVARAERDRLPLVVDRDDRIVWVAGLSIAEDFRVTEPASGVILLKARRLGGAG
jgi:tRNA(Ile)-lysidine synthase